MAALLIVSGLVCILALLSTVYLGLNQTDESYVKTVKKRMIILSSFYIIAFVPAIIFTIIFIVL